MNLFTRWWEVTRREFLAGLRRPSNWVLLVILGFMALGLSDGSVTVSSGESGVGGERPHITSVYNQSMIQTIVMLVLAAWFLAISCGRVCDSRGVRARARDDRPGCAGAAAEQGGGGVRVVRGGGGKAKRGGGRCGRLN